MRIVLASIVSLALVCGLQSSPSSADAYSQVLGATKEPTSPAFGFEKQLVVGDSMEASPAPYAYGKFGSFAFNDQQEVAVSGDVGTLSFPVAEGLFVTRPGLRRAVTLRNTLLSGFENSWPAINNAGEIVSFVQDPQPDGRFRSVIRLFSNGETRDLLAAGQLLPDGRTVEGFYSDPTINDNGDVIVNVLSISERGEFVDYFVFSGDQMTRVAGNGAPAPGGGEFASLPGFVTPPGLNDSGTVLVSFDIAGGEFHGRAGVFLVRNGVPETVALTGDDLPGRFHVKETSGIHGALNNRDEVVFVAANSDRPYKVGVFTYSGGAVSRIAVEKDAAPGGVFTDVAYGGQDGFYSYFPTPRINDNGVVLFNAKVRGADGVVRPALFLASSHAMLRVVQAGDRLPTGQIIETVSHYSLNNLNQVAFNAFEDNGFQNGSPRPVGVFIATPVAPAVESIKLKSKRSGAKLIVKGSAMVAGDAVVEIDGVALEALGYPSKSRNDDGTARVVTSTDARLDALIPQGATVQVTVFNPLTGKRSEPFAFTRN